MFNKLCVDIGSSNIKIIYGKYILGKLVIYKSEIIDTPQNSFTNGYINKKEVIAERLKEFITTNKLNMPQISFVVHSSDILIRTIKLPTMSRSNILKSIEWELKNYTKGPITDYHVEYAIQEVEQIKNYRYQNEKDQKQKVQKTYDRRQLQQNLHHNVKPYVKGNKLLKVFFVVVPKMIVNQYESLAKLSGAKIKCIEIASVCASRFLQGHSKNYFVVDFGYESVRISLYEGDFIFADRELMLKQPNNLQQGQTKTNDSAYGTNLNKITKENLESVLKNLSQMTDYYLSIDINHSISEIYTSGGLAVDSRVCEFVESTALTSPYSITDYKRIQADDKLKRNINLFTNVIGLLLRK